jgi:hypothetical protein
LVVPLKIRRRQSFFAKATKDKGYGGQGDYLPVIGGTCANDAKFPIPPEADKSRNSMWGKRIKKFTKFQDLSQGTNGFD